MFSVDEAVKAQRALREAGGQGAEMLPVQAFVGMISDEVEVLRRLVKSDEEIARIIKENSSIDISAAEIAENYATPEERHHHGG